MGEVAIIIPLYNEEKVILEVLKNLREKRPDDEIVVVDDGSKDRGCSEVAKMPGVYLLKHMVNLGQGAALQTGISFAVHIQCKYAVTFDSDGQHSAEDIEDFVEALRESRADIVLGSRFLGTHNASTFKAMFLKLSTVFAFLTTGIKLSDSHNGFRAINIEKFPQFEIRQNRMAHASEILDIIKELNMKYIEMPCNIRYTDYSVDKGQSLFNSINIVIEYLIGKVMR